MIPVPHVSAPKRYSVIYADPPWDVQKISRKVRPNQGPCLDYPTMSLEEIKGLPVRSLAADDVCLFLWTTHTYLPKAFGVMATWGFRYQRTITWDKQNGMCLFGFHYRTEFLLFGYKGKCPEMYPKRPAFPTIVTAKSVRHSAKPSIFRELILPFGSPRIELFARERTPVGMPGVTRSSAI